MLVTVIGGSGSGKSEFAECIAQKYHNRRLFYIATMKPYGEEALVRINRHRKMREKKGFETVECYNSLKKLDIENSVVLLECMSNLVANEIFDMENKNTSEEIVQAVFALAQKNVLIVVTNDVFSDGNTYPEETMDYIRAVSKINIQLVNMSDTVAEVVCGIPIYIKGGEANAV